MNGDSVFDIGCGGGILNPDGRGPVRDGDGPFVQETTKISEIRDNFGKLRFKVFLVDLLDYYEETPEDGNYRISVESYCYGLQPVTILTEFRRTYREARDFFDKCVANYRDLVLAETKNFEDIRIYAEMIGYHRVSPDCCATCKYSRVDPRRAGAPAMRCMNAALFKAGGPRRHVRDVQPVVSGGCVCRHFERGKKLRGGGNEP